MRRCLMCGERYQPQRNTLERLCGRPACALAFVRTHPERAQRLVKRARAVERRDYRLRTMTPGQAAALAQRAFNAWIRWRDRALPCVSCGRPNDGTCKWNAGHYRSTAAHPELRFDPANVHGQCERCNTYLSGNLTPYRIELIRRVGMPEVLRLEGHNELTHRTVADFLAVRAQYTRELRTMQAAA